MKKIFAALAFFLAAAVVAIYVFGVWIPKNRNELPVLTIGCGEIEIVEPDCEHLNFSKLNEKEIAEREIAFGGPDKNSAILFVDAVGLVDQNNQPCVSVSFEDEFDDCAFLTNPGKLEDPKPFDDFVNDILAACSEDGGERNLLLVFNVRLRERHYDLPAYLNGFIDLCVKKFDDLAEVAQEKNINLSIWLPNQAGQFNYLDSNPNAIGTFFKKEFERQLPRCKNLSELREEMGREVARRAAVHLLDQNPVFLPESANFDLARSPIHDAELQFFTYPKRDGKRPEWKLLEDEIRYRDLLVEDPAHASRIASELITQERRWYSGKEIEKLTVSNPIKKRIISNSIFEHIVAFGPRGLNVPAQFAADDDTAFLELANKQEVQPKQEVRQSWLATLDSDEVDGWLKSKEPDIRECSLVFDVWRFVMKNPRKLGEAVKFLEHHKLTTLGGNGDWKDAISSEYAFLYRLKNELPRNDEALLPLLRDAMKLREYSNKFAAILSPAIMGFSDDLNKRFDERFKELEEERRLLEDGLFAGKPGKGKFPELLGKFKDLIDIHEKKRFEIRRQNIAYISSLYFVRFCLENSTKNSKEDRNEQSAVLKEFLDTLPCNLANKKTSAEKQTTKWEHEKYQSARDNMREVFFDDISFMPDKFFNGGSKGLSTARENLAARQNLFWPSFLRERPSIFSRMGAPSTEFVLTEEARTTENQAPKAAFVGLQKTLTNHAFFTNQDHVLNVEAGREARFSFAAFRAMTLDGDSIEDYEDRLFKIRKEKAELLFARIERDLWATPNHEGSGLFVVNSLKRMRDSVKAWSRNRSGYFESIIGESTSNEISNNGTRLKKVPENWNNRITDVSNFAVKFPNWQGLAESLENKELRLPEFFDGPNDGFEFRIAARCVIARQLTSSWTTDAFVAKPRTEVYFRGHVATVKMLVKSKDIASVELTHRPSKTRIRVEPKKEKSITVSIVIDCSWSMRGGKLKRWKEELLTLLSENQGLGKFGENIKLNLYAIGAIRDIGEGLNFKVKALPRGWVKSTFSASVRNNIRKLKSSGVIECDDVNGQRLSKESLEKFRTAIKEESLEAYGITPIVAGLSHAYTSPPKDESHFVILLSDGEENDPIGEAAYANEPRSKVNVAKKTILDDLKRDYPSTQLSIFWDPPENKSQPIAIDTAIAGLANGNVFSGKSLANSGKSLAKFFSEKFSPPRFNVNGATKPLGETAEIVSGDLNSGLLIQVVAGKDNVWAASNELLLKGLTGAEHIVLEYDPSSKYKFKNELKIKNEKESMEAGRIENGGRKLELLEINERIVRFKKENNDANRPAYSFWAKDVVTPLPSLVLFEMKSSDGTSFHIQDYSIGPEVGESNVRRLSFPNVGNFVKSGFSEKAFVHLYPALTDSDSPDASDPFKKKFDVSAYSGQQEWQKVEAGANYDLEIAFRCAEKDGKRLCEIKISRESNDSSKPNLDQILIQPLNRRDQVLLNQDFTVKREYEWEVIGKNRRVKSVISSFTFAGDQVPKFFGVTAKADLPESKSISYEFE